MVTVRRACERCGGPASSSRHHYCDECRVWTQERRRQRANAQHADTTTRARGYGSEHRRLRRRWEREVEAGEVACARCGRLIHPEEAWDLGHDDSDRSIYTGPEHARCNRQTATHARQRRDRPGGIFSPVRRDPAVT